MTDRLGPGGPEKKDGERGTVHVALTELALDLLDAPKCRVMLDNGALVRLREHAQEFIDELALVRDAATRCEVFDAETVKRSIKENPVIPALSKLTGRGYIDYDALTPEERRAMELAQPRVAEFNRALAQLALRGAKVFVSLSEVLTTGPHELANIREALNDAMREICGGGMVRACHGLVPLVKKIERGAAGEGEAAIREMVREQLGPAVPDAAIDDVMQQIRDSSKQRSQGNN